MLRLIVLTADGTHAAHVGGEVIRTAATFDLDLPEVEAALSKKLGDYESRSITYEIR